MPQGFESMIRSKLSVELRLSQQAVGVLEEAARRNQCSFDDVVAAAVEWSTLMNPGTMIPASTSAVAKGGRVAPKMVGPKAAAGGPPTTDSASGNPWDFWSDPESDTSTEVDEFAPEASPVGAPMLAGSAVIDEFTSEGNSTDIDDDDWWDEGDEDDRWSDEELDAMPLSEFGIQ